MGRVENIGGKREINKLTILNYMTNEIIIIKDISLELKREMITDEIAINKFLQQIQTLPELCKFDFNREADVKEAKSLKTQAKKFIQELDLFCEPFEADGKKVANARSKIKTALKTGKDNVIDKILEPLNDVEVELKKLKIPIAKSPNKEVNIYQTGELEKLKNRQWFIYQQEAVDIIDVKLTFLAGELASFEKQEVEEKARQDAIRKEEEEKRLKAQQEREEADRKVQEQLKVKQEAEKRTNEANRRTVHTNIVNALKPICGDTAETVLNAIIQGEVPRLTINY
jgi:hypothetical protein